jgi:signal transduction histidine kinase
MRERLNLGGLRGRLLVAFVVTSMLTLAVVGAIVLGPLQTQLRDQSVETLNDALVASAAEFSAALTARDEVERRTRISNASFDLRERVDTRVLVDADDDEFTLPEFTYDSDFSPSSTRDAAVAALTAIREDRPVRNFEGDQVTIAVRRRNAAPDTDGVLVAERRLTEVAAAATQVRNALLRRLARLRAAALRITKEGPDAPAPRDTGRDEVGDLALALGRMQEELRRQEAARRSFVSTASHELRTPLTMLQGTMELLAEDLRDGGIDIEDAQLQVTNARRELRRLSALAGELLDLSRLDAAVQLRSEPVELGELARAVAAEFELRGRERDVELQVHPPADGCWGRGDPDAVARVVRILLDNALRYGPAGEPIVLDTALHDGRAGVTVADRGPGIPAEEREHVFERFHRGRAAGSESGFGLGLAIGRELAERMGGSLRLAEGDAPGARFELLLPAAEPDAPPRPARPQLSRSS